MSNTFIVTLAIGILLYFIAIGDKSQKIFLKFIWFFSSQIYYSFMKVPIPGNVMIVNSILISAITFDPLEQVKIW